MKDFSWRGDLWGDVKTRELRMGFFVVGGRGYMGVRDRMVLS